jgi:hypothetical protein
MAWVMWLVNVPNGVSFLAGISALWQMTNAADALMAVKWGVGALFLFQIATLCKTIMGNRMEVNRLLRELKRVELQLSLLRPMPERPSNIGARRIGGVHGRNGEHKLNTGLQFT